MRQITILNATLGEGSRINLTAAFWIPVPVGTEQPKPGAQSAIPKDTDVTGGVTVDEVALLQKGQILEEVRSFTVPGQMPTGDIQNVILTDFNGRVAYYNSLPIKGQLY